MIGPMQARMIAFGLVEIDGRRYDHDVVIEGERLRRRRKGPSKRYRDRYGHTPLSVDEKLPWGASRLIIGTGATGSLPVMTEVLDEARRRRIEVIVRPTAEACALLEASDPNEVAAVLHVTC